MTTKAQLIAKLGLSLHPSEGGYYRRTYTSDLAIHDDGVRRQLLSSIYYLLSDDSPIGYLHKNKSDIVHYYHAGAPIKYLIIQSDGALVEKILGINVSQGEVPQLLVKGGDWKASELCLDQADSMDYGLMSEAVSPGFEYDDNTIATLEEMTRLFPSHVSTVAKYIKPLQSSFF